MKPHIGKNIPDLIFKCHVLRFFFDYTGTLFIVLTYRPSFFFTFGDFRKGDAFTKIIASASFLLCSQFMACYKFVLETILFFSFHNFI
ncbi:hypothetical protein CXU21_01925 [Akkermansia muciniphila]|nr:hypothetical protein CXU21_01925 [Akkermansia muciniphila]